MVSKRPPEVRGRRMKRVEYINKDSLINGIYNRQFDKDFDLMLYISQFPARKHGSFMELVDKLRELSEDELERANKQFPMFHSYHEGLSVIDEEIWEADREMTSLYTLHQKLKEEVFTDKDNKKGLCIPMRDTALKAAAEILQVAAMCQKMINS